MSTLFLFPELHYAALYRIFPSPLFIDDTSVEALLFALDVLCQIRLQMGFGFPNSTLANSDSVFVFLLVDQSLLPPLAHYFFIPDFSQELLLLYPCFNQKIHACC